jgi:hypothetical protein
MLVIEVHAAATVFGLYDTMLNATADTEAGGIRQRRSTGRRSSTGEDAWGYFSGSCCPKGARSPPPSIRDGRKITSPFLRL